MDLDNMKFNARLLIDERYMYIYIYIYLYMYIRYFYLSNVKKGQMTAT